ncbi:glycine zipper family protein [Cerasicoccus maritimus]|uniref:glycine zipper family protein n=1 Tax=Cerasicoccus maritimus TaxID=490089 RepID=UPI002852786F|nr:glycine zipper family protein [Cerasicoccus maritimus]
MKNPLRFPCQLASASLLILYPALSADTLELRNGSTLKGSYEGGTPEFVRFNFNGATQDYNRGDIASLTFSKEAPSKPIEVTTASEQTIASSAPTSSTVIEIPTGATLMVSLQSGINSGKVKPGQSFPAVLISDLRVGNEIVLPAGTVVQGKVVEAKSAGRLRKSADLTLTIDSISYNGQQVAVKTSTQQETSAGKGGRKVLGGAAEGAAMGAIFGAINGDAGDGAAGGAAAGAASGLLRKGDNVEYSAGSVLAFTLESPVRL